ncbi:MAG: hypothetical protein JO202_15710 [Ktedonobacteraceae bacterium]|nr:hypothetical protein [Ktedonobacteraceae bacterium]
MVFNNDAGRNGAVGQVQRSPGSAEQEVSWRDVVPRTPASRLKRRGIFTLVSIILLVTIIFSALRVSMVAGGNNDQLEVRIGAQQPAQVDLRQSLPISTHLFGVNVFPKAGTSSLDHISAGFMNYTPVVINGLQDMSIKFLRYPGGEWGEQHVLTLGQLSDFSTLLTQTNSDGMIQAHLSGPVKDEQGNFKPLDLNTDLNVRANLAGRWVDYMNNPHSDQRKALHAHDPFHPVKLWTVGNEPDQPTLINPLTNQPYTVADYVTAFIQFSKAMHQNDPTIKVFGPELSSFYGVGAGPFDAGGHPWMDDFLKGIGSYEQANHVTLLDGISFHYFPFENAQQAPALLMSSSNALNYLLPPLRELIRRDLGRDVPIAITEVNTNPSQGINPSHGQAAIWWADTLGMLLNQQVEYAAFFSASDVDSPYPLFIGNGLRETAMARVMQLFAHVQSNQVPVAVEHTPISMYATQDDSHQAVSLLFVNKSPTPQLIQIRPVDQFLIVSLWPSLDVSIAGNSIVVLTLHRSSTTQLSGAEAYSYIVPAKDDPTAAPLSYTVCGHKSDALANDVPC